MKKNKFIIFYSIFATLGILFALSFLGYNLFNEYNHGFERTRRRFDHLTNNIKKLSSKEYTSTNSFKLDLEKAIADTSDFSFLQISQNGKVIYIYPDINSTSDDSSNLIEHYYEYFATGEVNYHISADLYVLRPYSIYYYARFSFLIILIITIITAIFIIYYNCKDNTKLSEEFSSNDSQTSENENVFEKAFEEKSQNISNKIDEADAAAIPADDTDNSEKENIIQTTSKEVPVQKEQVELPVGDFEPVKIPMLEEQKDSVPSGLFSPVTGLGWEQYLMTRLDNELNRAISSEFDLSLFLIKIPNISRDSQKIKDICNYLIEMFQFKDLLFEYKEDSIAAIKINMTLDNALNFADKLYVEIKNILGMNEKCFMGISSRTIRMVTGERLLKETDEALQHALESPEDPIIAFRANAEKYRQFIEKN